MRHFSRNVHTISLTRRAKQHRIQATFYCANAQAAQRNRPGGASKSPGGLRDRETGVFLSRTRREHINVSLPEKSIWYKRNASIREACNGLRQWCNAPQKTQGLRDSETGCEAGYAVSSLFQDRRPFFL